jgi:uncharacterized protein (DUF2345 family)
VSFDATMRTITRSSGDWTGLAAGMHIKVWGPTANATEGAAYYTIASVDGATITLVAGPELFSDRWITVEIVPIALDPLFAADGTVTLPITVVGPTFSGSTIIPGYLERRSGSWITDGFQVGDLVRISGSTANDTEAPHTYTVTAVTASRLTLSASDRLVDEAAGENVTVTRGQRPAATAIAIERNDDVNLTVTGNISVTAGGAVRLGSEQDLRIDTITAGGAVRLRTRTNIYDVRSSDGPAVTGTDLVLEASSGTIRRAAAGAPFRVTVLPGGSVTARATGDIHLRGVGPPGHLPLETIFSAGGDVRLEAVGSILDRANTDFINIRARKIELDAGADIGAAGNHVDVDIPGSGTVAAVANGSIWLAEAEGNLQHPLRPGTHRRRRPPGPAVDHRRGRRQP